MKVNVNRDRRYDLIIVGGFGRVGLPLGIVLADAGLQVQLYDIDSSRRATIEAGRRPFMDHDAEPILRRVIGKTLHIANGLHDIVHSALVVMTVGTPVDEYQNPRTKPLLELAEDMSQHLQPGHCLIVRSTVYPGLSSHLNEFFKRQGLEVHLAYCPERIVQGYAIHELCKLTQIVSGFTETAVHCAETLFKRLGVPTLRTTVQEAELVKLFTNAWRYIQFAIANQFYIVATEHGANYPNIYHAMTHDYERARDLPGPGFAAGPCLMKDTLMLAAFYGNRFQIGQTAMMINEGLPNFIVNQLMHLGFDLNKLRVGVLGMAFKADIDDIRDSLSYKLVKHLRFRGAEVVCSDEYVHDPLFVPKEQLVTMCQVVIVGVPHSSYATLVVPKSTCLLDLWGIIPQQPGSMAEINSATLPQVDEKPTSNISRPRYNRAKKDHVQR